MTEWQAQRIIELMEQMNERLAKLLDAWQPVPADD